MTSHGDLERLDEILELFASMSEDDALFDARAQRAFENMKDQLLRPSARSLTIGQRQWVDGIYERLTGAPSYENAYSAGRVPKGKDVPTPKVLENLPKRPPGKG